MALRRSRKLRCVFKFLNNFGQEKDRGGSWENAGFCESLYEKRCRI